MSQAGRCPARSPLLAAVVSLALAGTATAGIFPFFCFSNSDCEDGLFCTTDLCLITSCASIPTCFGDGNPCTVDSCDEQGRACVSDPVPLEGSPCDDGLFCDGADVCQGGTCSQHAGDPCPVADGDDNCREACDEATDTCTANEPDETLCDDGRFCTAVDLCRGGVCQGTESPCPGPDGDADCAESCDELTDSCTRPDPKGAPCADGGRTGTCDGEGVCSIPVGRCGDGIVTPALGEQCDGGECCTAACTFKGPSEQCGVETRVCHDRPLCNGHDAACPNAERVSSEGSTCSDDEACTLEDTCRQGECTPGPRVCNAEAVVLGNGHRSMRVAVRCFSDQAGDCEATVLALAPAAVRRDAAEVPSAITATKRSKLKRAKHGGALKFTRKLTLRLNAAGKAALATDDLSAQVVVTVRRLGSDFRPSLAGLRLLKFKR